MKFAFAAFLVLTLHAYTSNSKNLPSFIKKCKRNDPRLDDCMKTTVMDIRLHFRNGIKEMNIPPADPFVIPRVDFATGWMKGAVTNLKMHRIHTYEIDSLKININGNPVIVILYHHPFIYMEGYYEMDGMFLQFPLHGVGKLEMRFNDTKSFLSFEGHKTQKNGKEYMTLNKGNYTLLSTTIHQFYLHDLFAGNEELTDRINSLFFENKDSLYNDLKPIVDEVLSATISSMFQGTFDNYALDELFD